MLRIVDLLRPHWKAMTMALVGVGGAAAADLLEPWPIKIVLDYALISRVTSDIDSIQDLVASAMLGIFASILTLLGIFASILTLLGIVGIMLYASWRFTLISLAIAPVLFVIVYFFTRADQEGRA